MKIPSKFEEILKKDQTQYSIVLNVINNYESIYKDNKLYFFEEYTDHGISHIENVLKACEFIISNNSIKNLNPKDTTVLILAVILHDIGMHTEFATFKALLDGSYNSKRNQILDSKTWDEMWDEYISEVKRFSSQQRKNIFGDENHPFKIPDLTSKDRLDGSDKKLIGEFVRRHHPRLAHEIAINGIVGKNGEFIPFGPENLSLLYKQLAGIVARSHGMNLRDTFEYLIEIGHDGWRNPDDVLVIFLMVVLRIADYMQIDSSRTDPNLLKLKTFNSPISQNEHKTHLAITSISFTQPDQEMFLVICDPQNSEMYVKLKKLFTDIQSELDVSWAVLGEVYGFLSIEKPHIRFRRIKSNLEDKKYIAKLPYIAKKVRVEITNEISKLLVAPLYGSNPTYAIRELVQNAVDACIERTFLEKKYGDIQYEPLVYVTIDSLDESRDLIKITDNGKGMSEFEIINYFLNVGSSSRKSVLWKNQFTDENGNSEVLRNGRFGVGVLAAFLLGDNISVRTKHYKNEETFEFNTCIDSDFIFIKKSKDSYKGGTTISIEITKEKSRELTKTNQEIKWYQWYLNEVPRVEYFVYDFKVKKVLYCSYKNSNHFKTDNFDIYWSLEIEQPKDSNIENALIVNGILLSKKTIGIKLLDLQQYDLTYNYPILPLKPCIVIEDPNGQLPIKLDRSNIEKSQLPFEQELRREVCKYFIAQILSAQIEIPQDNKDYQNIPISLRYGNIHVFYSNIGYTLSTNFFISELIFERNFFLIDTKESIFYSEFLEIPNSFCLISDKSSTIESTLIYQKEIPRDFIYNPLDFISYRTFKKGKFDLFYYKKLTEQIQKIPKEIQSLLNNETLENVLSIKKLKRDYFKVSEDPILEELLKLYIGTNVIIPYDLKEREKLFPKAFKELKKYMRNDDKMCFKYN